jgi:hypothetical protein
VESMGQRNQRRQKFLREHPTCCFCGGNRPAVGEDHFPSRTVFTERQWPEGYVFPACLECNGVTRLDELLVSFLSRMRPNPTERVVPEEFTDLLRAIRNNFPGLLEAMKATHRDQRDAQRKYGLPTPPGGTIADIPVLKLTDPRIHDAVANFSRKLGLAIYYKETGLILTHEGAIASRWYANAQIDNNEIDRDLIKVLPSIPTFQRGNVPLKDQFFYRVGVTDDKGMATFLAFFRQSFAVLGLVSARAGDFEAIPAPYRVGGPYVRSVDDPR